jgi:hypothetical protein
VIATLVISRIPLPRFVTLTVSAALAVPTEQLGKESFLGKKWITGPLVAEEAAVKGTQRKARLLMATRRAARFTRAYCRSLARGRDLSLLGARRA